MRRRLPALKQFALALTLFAAAITLFAGALTLFAGAQGCDSGSKAATTPESRIYTLVLLKTGTKNGKLSTEDNRAAFDGHFSNMMRMANEKQLLLAGPYGDARHDETLHGLFVMNSAERAKANEWSASDPTTKAGVFLQEPHDLSTDAPLGAMLDKVLARDAATKASGKTPKPGDGARSYVILSSDKLDVARRELEPLKKGGGVFLLATIDGKTVLAVLDAKNVADAQQKFGPLLTKIGDCQLDDWFATDQVAHLAEL